MDLSEASTSSWSVAQMGGAGRGSICCRGHGSRSVWVWGGSLGVRVWMSRWVLCCIIEGSSFVKGNEVIISSAGSARLD